MSCHVADGMQILFLRFLRLHLQYTISWLYIKMRERYRSTSPTATTTESTSSTITRGENPAPVSSENRTWGGSTHHNHSEPRIRTRCYYSYSILLLSSVVAIAVTCYGRIVVSYFQHNKNVYRNDRNIQKDYDLHHTSSSMTEPTSIKIVTMNIAQLVLSGKAPNSWVANPQLALDYLRQTLLCTNPDIIALQECPSPLWVDTFLVDYQQYYYPTSSSIPQTTASHAGYVALWVRKDWATQVDAVSAVHLPAVAARVSFTNAAGSRRLEIWIASMHLEPFQQGSFTRKDQLEELLQLAASHQTQEEEVVVILAGDTNMRDEEDRVVEDSLKLVDAWKAAGADPHTRFSWDTTARTIANGNHHQTAVWQNLYYGSNTRAYQRRYDRIYYHCNATNDKTDDRDGELRVTVPSFRLIANEPIGQSTEHFLSDHFGLAAEIRIEWS